MNQNIDPKILERFLSTGVNANLPHIGFSGCGDIINNSGLKPIRGAGYNTPLNIEASAPTRKYSSSFLKSLDHTYSPFLTEQDIPSSPVPQNDYRSSNHGLDHKNWSADHSHLAKLLNDKLKNSKNNVEVLRHNSDHPLNSVHTFESLQLLPELLRGIYEMGFAKPSKIQEITLPLILSSQQKVNLIAQSQSGTGKTAAYALGVLQKLDLSLECPAQALILAPTYELALQIGDVIKKMGKYLGNLKLAYAVKKKLANEKSYGHFNNSHLANNYSEHLEDYDIFYQKGRLVNAHIVVGTPGSVYDWMRSGMLDGSRIKMFVLDEADVMIDQQGHRSTSVRIHKFLDKENCQFLLFSATYDENEVLNFATDMVPEPNVVLRLKREEETLDNIDQFYIPCLNAQDRRSRDDVFEAKIKVLCDIYASFNIGQCVIFCDSKAEGVKIAQSLINDCGHGSVALLTSELTVDQRAAVIKRFKAGLDERVLVATNVLARGIDIESVSMVVNFSVPRKFIEDNDRNHENSNHNNNENHAIGDRRRGSLSNEPDYETYLHRIGRTGRFGRNGISFILIDRESEDSPEYLMVKTLENFYKRTIKKFNPQNGDYDQN